MPPRPRPARNSRPRFELRIAADLATEFPGLKVPLDHPQRKFEFHIEVKPGGGFTLHSADPNAPPIDGATHDDLQSHVIQKLIAIGGNDAGPELALRCAERDARRGVSECERRLPWTHRVDRRRS